MIAVPAVIVVALVAALGSSHGGASQDPPTAATASAPAPTVNRFDAARAWRLLRYQVGLGPRPAGSAPLLRLAYYARARLPHGHFEAVPGHPGLRNVVGRIPGRRPAVAVAAHYDTKDLPGFVGANDGAGGTAEVLELARALRHLQRPKGAPEIRFLFFDGEEATDDSEPFLESGVRGSRAYAERHGRELRALVLLDFVANRGTLRIPYEPGSDLGL